MLPGVGRQSLVCASLSRPCPWCVLLTPSTQTALASLLTPASTAYLLNILRATASFTDGVRLNLTTNERLRVATKAGWFEDGRNEAGIMFSEDNRAILIYSMFASGQFDGDKATNDADFSTTHPAVAARAGRTVVLRDGLVVSDTPNGGADAAA